MAPNTVNGTIMEKKRSWFGEDESNRVNQEILQPANETLRGREQFKQRVQRLLKGKGGQVPTTKEGLRQQIEELDSGQLRELANGELQGAGRAHSIYVKERTTGVKNVGHKAQKFVRVFANFLGAYSGIVELVKGAGQQYGQVAYETLSLFLTVVVNKCDNDTRIANFLSELHKSFPQLDTLMEVYPSITLKKCVVSVYKEVIIFARGASDYFARFSVRLWMAIGKPPSMGIDVTVATIHSKLAEVNSEAMVLLHSRSLDIHKGVEQLNAKNEGLSARIKQLQLCNEEQLKELQEFRINSDLRRQQEDDDRLEGFRQTLDIPYPCPEIEMDTCSHGLFEAFPNVNTSSRKAASKYEQMTPDLLNEQKAYLDWQSSAHSCLLLLSGTTAPDGRSKHNSTYSWLSPAAVHIAEQVQNEKNLLVYYCCHPELHAKKPRVADVMSSLVFQILKSKPVVLRQKHQHFQSIVQKWQRPGQEPKDDRAAIQAMVQLLHEVLMEIKADGMVYIVLDRVELCNCKTHYLMDELAKLVGEESCAVKIVAVIDGDEWDTSNLEKKTLTHVMRREGWRQQRMPSYERRKKMMPLP